MKTLKIQDTKTRKRRSIKTSRQLGVKMFVKLPHGETIPWTSKKTKLAQTLARITEKQWAKGVSVTVKYQKDVTNGATFYSKEAALKQVTIWLEPSLVEYATDNNW